MEKQKPRDKRLDCFRKMPFLWHKYPGQKYEADKSQVLAWIAKQPELLEYLFELAKRETRTGPLIVYHEDVKCWFGVDYGQEDSDHEKA